MDEETISYIKRIKGGFEINEETLAVDIIKSVGQGGNYLKENHTVEHIRKEYWRPIIFNRDSYTVWKEKDSKSLLDKARELKEHIMKNHQIDYVNPDVEKEIDYIVKKAKNDLLK